MASRVSQIVIEAAFLPTGAARVTQDVLEVLFPIIARSPATPTGAGVTQAVVEVLLSGTGTGRVSQYVVEVLLDDRSLTYGEHSGPSVGGQTTFGYAT